MCDERHSGASSVLIWSAAPVLLANKRKNAMNASITIFDQAEEAILSYEVSDQALEAAATAVKDRAGSFTLAFCSGLDSCPG
jgi:hypothetical protein